MHRASGDGKTGDSVDATKQWVNAKIAIAQTATNAVGAPHTFTVTLQKDTGNGNGFAAAAGEHVVHDHVHVELGGDGYCSCLLDLVGGWFGAVHGADGRERSQLRERDQDVR